MDNKDNNSIDNKSTHMYPIRDQKRELATGKQARQAKFLTEYPHQNYNITKTCQAIGISRSAYKLWIKEDPAFKEACQEQREAQNDYLEESILNQGIVKQHPITQIFLAKSFLTHGRTKC